jgi:hypothetical protein
LYWTTPKAAPSRQMPMPMYISVMPDTPPMPLKVTG